MAADCSYCGAEGSYNVVCSFPDKINVLVPLSRKKAGKFARLGVSARLRFSIRVSGRDHLLNSHGNLSSHLVDMIFLVPFRWAAVESTRMSSGSCDDFDY